MVCLHLISHKSVLVRSARWLHSAPNCMEQLCECRVVLPAGAVGAAGSRLCATLLGMWDPGWRGPGSSRVGVQGRQLRMYGRQACCSGGVETLKGLGGGTGCRQAGGIWAGVHSVAGDVLVPLGSRHIVCACACVRELCVCEEGSW